MNGTKENVLLPIEKVSAVEQRYFDTRQEMKVKILSICHAACSLISKYRLETDSIRLFALLQINKTSAVKKSYFVGYVWFESKNMVALINFNVPCSKDFLPFALFLFDLIQIFCFADRAIVEHNNLSIFPTFYSVNTK